MRKMSHASIVMAAVALGAPALLSESASADPVVSKCSPDCRRGYTCIESVCTPACNPICGPEQQCVPVGDGFDCVRQEVVAPAVPVELPGVRAGDGGCVPACGDGERCLQTSKGPACLAATRGASRTPVRDTARTTVPRDERPSSQSWRQPEPAWSPNAPSPAKASYNYAKPAAITLGVLFAIGGIINVAASSQANEPAAFIASGIIGMGLGTWGIVAGVVSD